MHIRSAAVVATAVLACAGCESATSGASPTTVQSPSSSAAASANGPHLSGTVAISGGATIPTTPFATDAQLDTGQTQVAPPPGATCADYANGFKHAPNVVPLSFVAPMIQTSGFHSIYVQVIMSTGYAGPGRYDSAHIPSMSGSAVEGIGTASSLVYTVFHARDSGSIVLTVKPDGSGSLQIEHWDSDEVRQVAGSSQVNISGVVTWDCH